ncbi:hypothetical protein ACFL1H_02400 [Nanoarchaeota archaeon]
MFNLGKFFRREPAWYRVDIYVRNAFERVKADVHHLSSWVRYLKHKDDENENSHFHLNRELGEHKVMISYMNAQIQQMKLEFDMLKKDKSGTSQGQVRTSQRTFTGQVEDKSGQVPEPQNVVQNSELTGAQEEVLELLYHSDRPLGYKEIAKRLQKAPKSIRNIIYEIREIGLNIKDKPIGIRQKGFYLDEKTKITISGR